MAEPSWLIAYATMKCLSLSSEVKKARKGGDDAGDEDGGGDEDDVDEGDEVEDERKGGDEGEGEEWVEEDTD